MTDADEKRRPSTRCLLITVACWIAALAVIGWMAHWTISSGLADLKVYRAGAVAVLHGRHLYSVQTAQRLPFTYPPVAAVLAVPLALVPVRVAEIAWVLVVYVPLVVAVRISFRELLQRAGRYRLAVLAVLTGCSAFLVPVEQVMSFGQIDLLLVALCLLDCQASRPWWPRGALIGLAAAIKLEPTVFVVYLLITGRHKAAAVAASSFAALTAIAYLAAPGDSVTYWTSAIFNTRRIGGNAAAGNQSLRGMILRAVPASHVASVVWLLVAAVIAAAGFTAARSCWLRGDDMAGIAITALLLALLSPVAWIHHLCWIAVAIGVITGSGRDWTRVIVAAAAFGLFLIRVPTWAQSQTARQPEVVRGFLEDSFGLAALCLIGLIYASRPPNSAAAGSGVPPAPEPSELAEPVS